MILELEWRVPWDVPKEKRELAAEKLRKYILEGTLFESRTRMIVTSVQVKKKPEEDPYLVMVLEN